jgi:protein-tyrosine phosphatase
MDFKQILFLCAGNYYRSRYAEEFFNFYAIGDGLAWRAFSRGLAEKGSPDNLGPMSRFTLQALRAKSIVPQGWHATR